MGTAIVYASKHGTTGEIARRGAPVKQPDKGTGAILSRIRPLSYSL
jgi:menaquinone-dependent protoporphyrinogen IX oxidase